MVSVDFYLTQNHTNGFNFMIFLHYIVNWRLQMPDYRTRYCISVDICVFILCLFELHI